MDKFARIARRAGAVAPIAALALVASALVVPSIERAPAAHAEEASVTNVTVADDFTSARVDAKAQGHRVEVLSERTETSQTFVSAKGVVTREIAAAPIRVRDSSSDGWGAIDPTLSKKADGSYAPAAVPGEIRLSGGKDTDTTGVLVSLAAGKRSISLDWAGALPAPTIDGATATYKDVKPGMDLKVEVTRTGVEQYFVLKDRPAAGAEPTLALPIAADGVVVADGKTDRGQTIETKSGNAVGAISPALTWDATTEHGVHTQTDVSDSAVRTVDGKRSLVITPDADFLQSPDTTYPVTIDPSVTLTGSSISDVYLKSTAPDGNVGGTQLLVGTNDSGATKYRSLVTVTTGAAMKGATVQSASLGLWENSSASCTATPVTAYGFATRHYAVNQTWNSQPADINNPTTVTTAKGYSSSCAAGWVNFDVAQQLQASLNAPWEVMTVELRADETTNSGFKAFDSADGTHVPTLTVTYDLPPAKPLIPAVSAGTTGATKVYTSSLLPSFTATSADPETENVKYTYNVYNSASPQDSTTLVGTCTTGFVPSGSPASCAPNVALTDGTSYWARAIATDVSGISGKASSSLYFATAAARPTTPTVSCPTPYTDGSWASTAPSAAVACTVSVVGNYKGLGPKQIIVSLDGADNTMTPVAASGITTANISVPKTGGVHTITAYTVSGAQLSSTTVTYRFGYGSPGLATPHDGLKTLGPVKISAYAPFRGSAAAVSATLQWRVAGNANISAGWNTVSTTDVTPSTAASSPTFAQIWDSTTATADQSVTPAVPLNQRQSQRLNIRVCFTYDAASPVCTTDAGIVTTILRTPSGFGEAFPTTEAGEGRVALASGEFAVDVHDVDITTNLGELRVDRSHSTFADASLSGPAGNVFGAGWAASFGTDGSDVAALTIDDQTAKSGLLNLVDPTGSVLSYSTPSGTSGVDPTGTYIPVDDATAEQNTQVVVSASGASKTLTATDLSGNVTSWKSTAVGGTSSWILSTAAQAGAQSATTYTLDALGRITRVLAPVPDGVTCPATGPMNPGCSWLRLTYSSSTTATASAAGDFTGQLKSVYYDTFDPSTSALAEYKVAAYVYDSSGRLSVETNPLNSQTKTYQYAVANGNVELTSSATSGFAPYTYIYDNTGGNTRLSAVNRGSATVGGGDVVERSFIYNADVGSAGPDLSSSQVAKWGQTRTPTTAYAVFGLDHPLTGSPATSDWPYARLYYTDSEGYAVDSAQYGAGEWLVSVANYNRNGKNDFNLTPDDVDNAVAAAASGISFDPRANSPITRYAQAIANSSGNQSLVAANSLPLDSWSAPFTAVLQDGTTEQVRRHTHYSYDEGAPAGDVNPATGAPYMLATTVTTGVAGVADTSSDPTSALPDDIETSSVVKYGYAPSDGASATGATSGWTLGEPTTTTNVMPGSTDITHRTSYDANGNAISESEPGSSGADAGTLLTIPYTAGPNATDAACGGHPEWATLTCWTGPAAAPETGTDIPDSRTTYNRWLQPTSETETSGSGGSMVTRTTTSTYGADGRLSTTTTAIAGLSGSTPVAKTKALYSSSLLRTGTARLAADGSVMSQDVETLDQWGRRTKYLNNNVDNSNYTYVPAGSPGAGNLASLATPKGSYTFSYDGVDANGAIEHRGLRTGMSAPGLGSFSGAYDKSGGLVTEAMPGGITRLATFDELGRQTGLRYSGDVAEGGVTSTGTWLAFGRSYDTAGRTAADWSPSGASTQPGGYTRGYTYDRADRLAQATDSTGTTGTGTSCTTRAYAYDIRGNRTSLASSTAGDCTTVSQTSRAWTFDRYSRQLTAADGAAEYTIDPFGRETAIPAADAPAGAGAIALSYFDNDLVQSIAQGTSTTTFTIDPDDRRLSSTTATNSTSINTVNHYVDSTDSPAWVVQTSGSTSSTSVYVRGLDDLTVASVTGAIATLQLTDMTGSAVATAQIPASGHASSITSSVQFDEFGNTLTGAANSGVLAYGWKGARQRALATGGLAILGLRLYNSLTGRFSSRDSVRNGNENPYNYPNDPINTEDLDGKQLATDGGGPVTLRMIGDAIGARKGVYYIKDSTGKEYVGKAVNLRKRLYTWARSSRYKPLDINDFKAYRLKAGGDALDLSWLEQRVMDKFKIGLDGKFRNTWNRIRAMTLGRKARYEATRGIPGYEVFYERGEG